MTTYILIRRGLTDKHQKLNKRTIWSRRRINKDLDKNVRTFNSVVDYTSSLILNENLARIQLLNNITKLLSDGIVLNNYSLIVIDDPVISITWKLSGTNPFMFIKDPLTQLRRYHAISISLPDSEEDCALLLNEFNDLLLPKMWNVSAIIYSIDTFEFQTESNVEQFQNSIVEFRNLLKNVANKLSEFDDIREFIKSRIRDKMSLQEWKLTSYDIAAIV